MDIEVKGAITSFVQTVAGLAFIVLIWIAVSAIGERQEQRAADRTARYAARRAAFEKFIVAGGLDSESSSPARMEYASEIFRIQDSRDD